MDAEKPFDCKTDGCGMKFTNEDHLNVHQQKHEMNLNIEEKCGNFIGKL